MRCALNRGAAYFGGILFAFLLPSLWLIVRAVCVLSCSIPSHTHHTPHRHTRVCVAQAMDELSYTGESARSLGRSIGLAGLYITILYFGTLAVLSVLCACV